MCAALLYFICTFEQFARGTKRDTSIYGVFKCPLLVPEQVSERLLRIGYNIVILMYINYTALQIRK